MGANNYENAHDMPNYLRRPLKSNRNRKQPAPMPVPVVPQKAGQ
jgi:hypothetical protein